jgi:thioredoxin reductase (NADPH)
MTHEAKIHEAKIHEVCIIGSGPAGYTAAIYSARAMLNPILITGHASGGQLMTTTDIENFPGYVEGVSGPMMMEHLRAQAVRFGTSLITADVKSVDCKSKPLRISLDNGTEIFTKSIIIATGAQSLWLNLEGEKKLRSRGISTCATCDGAFFKGDDLIVVGGGDSAMEEATFLTRYAKSVTIIHRRKEFRASKIMIERAEKNKKIKWILNTTISEWISEKGNLCGAILKLSDGNKLKISCGGAFIAIGHKPTTNFLNDQIETDDNGYILHKEHTMTSVPGVFACGDVVDTRYKQAITAAGQGCQAAMDVEKWLEQNAN